MIYNFCITCEHYNNEERFPEACYGCFNGRNYEVNNYYDMTREDIENMIKSEEEDTMNNDAELKLDIIESDIIDELLVLTKKNNEMLIDIQKRLDESEGLIWPKHLFEEKDKFDEEKNVEAIIGDQEKEDNYVEDFRSFIETRNRILNLQIDALRSNSFYGMYAAYPDPLHSKHTGLGCRCADCVYSKVPFYEKPCNSCNGYSNYKLYYVPYKCEECKHADKGLNEEPCESCNIQKGNYKFEPMSSVDKMEKTIRNAFASCANAVKEFNNRFNETKEKK